MLDSYETERMPIAQQVIDGASAIHQIIMGHGKDLESRFELADDPEWLEMAVGRLSGIAYTYREVVPQPDGLTKLDGPQIGDRAPDAELGNGVNLFSWFRHPHMTLLVLPDSGDTEQLAEGQSIVDVVAQKYGPLIRHHVYCRESGGDNAGTSPTDRYHVSGQGRLYLVRPDGYIGHCCLLSEVSSLYEYLDGFLVTTG